MIFKSQNYSTEIKKYTFGTVHQSWKMQGHHHRLELPVYIYVIYVSADVSWLSMSYCEHGKNLERNLFVEDNK